MMGGLCTDSLVVGTTVLDVAKSSNISTWSPLAFKGSGVVVGGASTLLTCTALMLTSALEVANSPDSEGNEAPYATPK